MFETHKAIASFKAHIDQLRLAVEHFIKVDKKELAEEWMLELMALEESLEKAPQLKAVMLESGNFAHGKKRIYIDPNSAFDRQRLAYLKETIQLAEANMKEKGWML